MRKVASGAVLLFSFLLLTSQPALGQAGVSRVSGTIDDVTGALLPGVSVTATNTATGIVTTVLSNEAGAYTLPSLMPGRYTVAARLAGFQTKTFNDVELGNDQQLRLNFTLGVATVGTSVDVTVSVDALLATSSSSIGTVLSQETVQALPIVGNNIMTLLDTLPGTRMDANGVTGTFNGLFVRTVNVTRDGMESSGSARNMQAGMTPSTFMSPDLVGEIRMVVAPVDVEMGRGNGQMQVFTRSGSNRFTGTAVWSVRNTALDANTWANNRTIDSRTGLWKPTPKDWVNRNQYSLSLGGPIVRNKTFFFALWDGLLVNERLVQNPMVLTPCARRGVFRYFDGWNNGNVFQVIQPTGATPTIAVVDGAGNPVTPQTTPTGGAPGALRHASVFGPLAPNTPSRSDCADAAVQGASWDVNRKAMDPTGFVRKVLEKMPLPNNYEIGDGLNTAGYRWVRKVRGGSEGIFSFGGTGVGRKQFNLKLDHNFDSVHKVAATYTYERSAGGANLMTWPDSFSGGRYRRPQHLSITGTSTLSPTLINEARVGMRRQGFTQWSGITDPNPSAEVQDFFPNYNGYPVFVGLGLGQVNFQTNQPLGGGNTQRFSDRTVLWQYGDTLSWTRGTHFYKFGAEIRRGGSWGLDAGIAPTAVPRVIGGDLALSQIPVAAINSTNMPGLAGTNASGNNLTMRNLLSFLAGSVSSISQAYWMQDPKKLDAFDDYLRYPGKVRDMRINEFTFFVKDDWKILKSLTLNLGLRYDYFGVPYETSGMMPLPVGGGSAAFGISGRSYADWMKPGTRAGETVIQYVGKNSPNPDIPWHPDDWNNLGPAIGFAWQVPWFGDGKTTVRGGYQMTYQIGDGYSSMVQETNVPGSSNNVTYTGDSAGNAYLDLTKLSGVIPAPNLLLPMQPVPLNQRSQGIYIPYPDLVTPYAQNLTLSVTRSVGSKVSVDLRYVGTLGRKQRSAANNLNVPNFRLNGLKEAFDAVRRGDESTLLDSIFNGINIAGGAGFGPVGAVINGVRQTAGMHMRQSTTFRSNLANGNYVALANSLNTLNYATANNPSLPVIPPLVLGQVLRHNQYPENFVVANPQFSAVNLMTNNISNNYHSFATQITLRPMRRLTNQLTYTWSRNLGAGVPGADLLGQVFTDPLNRHSDYALLPDTRVHDIRSNGTFTLPFGPNQLFFGSTSGTLARIIEGWQLSWIVNLSSGAPLDLTAQNMLYNNGTPDVVGPFDLTSGEVRFSGSTSGTYFDTANFTQVRDPQCAGVTTLQNLRDACTLNAIADARTLQPLLQHPLPGTRGSLGQRAVYGPGRWRFDTSMSKSFHVREAMYVQVRVDATNVLNHPESGNPNLNLNNAGFGLINAKSNLTRELQGQLRISF